MKHAATGLREAEKELSDALEALEAAGRRHRLAMRMIVAWRTLKSQAAELKRITDGG